MTIEAPLGLGYVREGAWVRISRIRISLSFNFILDCMAPYRPRRNSRWLYDEHLSCKEKMIRIKRKEKTKILSAKLPRMNHNKRSNN